VTASLFMAVSFLLVAAALQRQGRPAGGHGARGKARRRAACRGSGWRRWGVAMQGHGDVLVCAQEKGGAGQEGGAQAALLVLAAGDSRGAALPGGAQAGGRAVVAGGPGAGGRHTGRAQAGHSDGGSICSWM
jgi:hypothetical protein